MLCLSFLIFLSLEHLLTSWVWAGIDTNVLLHSHVLGVTDIY
jgi:hypothetical protein